MEINSKSGKGVRTQSQIISGISVRRYLHSSNPQVKAIIYPQATDSLSLGGFFFCFWLVFSRFMLYIFLDICGEPEKNNVNTMLVNKNTRIYNNTPTNLEYGENSLNLSLPSSI